MGFGGGWLGGGGGRRKVTYVLEMRHLKMVQKVMVNMHLLRKSRVARLLIGTSVVYNYKYVSAVLRQGTTQRP